MPSALSDQGQRRKSRPACPADEYDAAQERGEVRGANERTASNPEAVGTEDIGHPALDLSGRVTA
jgi:hypothetical protein